MTARPGAKAVVLLSGGVDSATTLAIARSEGRACHCLTVDYGQRHRRELASAQAVARALGAEAHRVVLVDLRAIGGSALTDDIEVPKDRPAGEMAASIPVTYVPARNAVLLALALGWAEVIDAAEIHIGVTAVDYSGYPDCRPEFIEAFERMAGVATRMGAEGRRIRIRTPLVNLSKAEIVRRGSGLGVDYSLTFSCYDPGPEGTPCGRCDACLLRAEGFRAAGLPDPAAR